MLHHLTAEKPSAKIRLEKNKIGSKEKFIKNSASSAVPREKQFVKNLTQNRRGRGGKKLVQKTTFETISTAHS